ncbi:MAG: hypothetical protein WBM53_04820 [Maribacter sp.]
MKISSLLISILFLVITLANSLKIAGTIGYYAIFTEDFIENYCVNKERPELNCDGKCELSKMLMKETSDDAPPINLDLLKTENILFLASSVSFDLNYQSEIRITNPQYINLYDFSFTQKTIQPPEV